MLKCLLLFALFQGVVGEGICPLYQGCSRNSGLNGEECLNWEAQSVRRLWEFDPDNAIQYGIGDHNYCRNPGGDDYGIYCYIRMMDNQIKKRFCPPAYKTDCYEPPRIDPSCPGSQRTRTSDSNANTHAPDDTNDDETDDDTDTTTDDRSTVTVTADEGTSVVLDCAGSCPDSTWSARRSANHHFLLNGSVLITAVNKERDAGEWSCSCSSSGASLRITLEIVAGSNGDDNNGDDNNGDDDNNTDGDHVTPEDEEEDSRGKAAARADEESCEGTNCGLCKKNQVMCGMAWCVVAGMTIVIAVYLRQTFKWRKVEERLKYSLFHSLPRNGTVPTMRESMADDAEPQYAEALQLRARPLRSNSTVTFSREVPVPLPQLSRIRSDEIASHDDLACLTLSQAGGEFVSHFGGSNLSRGTASQSCNLSFESQPPFKLIRGDDGWSDDTRKDAGRDARGGTRGDTRGDRRGDTRRDDRRGDTGGDTRSDTRGDRRGDTRRDDTGGDRRDDTWSDTRGGTRGDSATQRSDVTNGNTMFDKYYDTDVDNWSLGETTQI